VSSTVPNVSAADPKDNVFCDIRRVVGNSLQISGDGKGVECLYSAVRLGLHVAG
jgi:hypothetical protein